MGQAEAAGLGWCVLLYTLASEGRPSPSSKGGWKRCESALEVLQILRQAY